MDLSDSLYVPQLARERRHAIEYPASPAAVVPFTAFLCRLVANMRVCFGSRIVNLVVAVVMVIGGISEFFTNTEFSTVLYVAIPP